MDMNKLEFILLQYYCLHLLTDFCYFESIHLLLSFLHFLYKI